jgi:5-methylcytosine-specific restriction endonuclease McrA
MKSYVLKHLADSTLLRDLAALVSQDRATTAALLAHIAEVDDRKLYLPAACSSMFVYCVRELRMSEETAFRRIRVARAARQFPAIYPALAEGRLNMTAVLLLTPHLRPDNADELLAAATHKSKADIELLLAERFPRADVSTSIRAVAPECHATQLAPEPVDQHDSQLAAWLVEQSHTPNAPAHVAAASPRMKITPLSASHFEMRLTIDRETQEQLRYAQALLGHAVPPGDVAQVLKRALNALVQQLEQKRFAKCVRSGKRKSKADSRYIPAEIRRSVWQRDQGQCTFVSARGRRCEERTRLEFDHTQPLAKGGQTTAGQIQLKCRAHNQYAAECAYGTEFMRTKREAAQHKSAQNRIHSCSGERAVARPNARAASVTAAPAVPHATQHDVIPWLRELGFSAEEARRGASQSAPLHNAPLEQRVRVALQTLAPARARRTGHHAHNSA